MTERVIKVFVEGFPEYADILDVQQYVRDALTSWGGGLCPGNEDRPRDPMFDGLKVKRVVIGRNVFFNID